MSPTAAGTRGCQGSGVTSLPGLQGQATVPYGSSWDLEGLQGNNPRQSSPLSALHRQIHNPISHPILSGILDVFASWPLPCSETLAGFVPGAGIVSSDIEGTAPHSQGLSQQPSHTTKSLHWVSLGSREFLLP